MNLGITDKVALVTASSRGLGRASAQALVDAGVKVAICGRNIDAVKATERHLASRGGSVLGIAIDVTQPDAPQRLIDEVIYTFGSLNILVANAGGPPSARALDVTDEGIAAAVNANLTTSIRLVRAAVPTMSEAGWGRICCITSSSIKQPIPTLALSNLSRTGLWAWAKTAAQDLFPYGVTLNLICPGLHATERAHELGFDLDGKSGDPSDFGQIVAFLCSQQSAYISGTAVMVDGAECVGLL